MPCSEVELQTEFKSLQQTIWDQTQTNTWIEQLGIHVSNPAGQFMRLRAIAVIWIRGDDNAHWISKNTMPATAAESYVAQISMKTSRICEFIQQGEWCRQNSRYAWVLTARFALLPWALEKQHPRSPVIIS